MSDMTSVSDEIRKVVKVSLALASQLLVLPSLMPSFQAFKERNEYLEESEASKRR